MIARLWSATTTADRAAKYTEYLRAHVLPTLRRIDGYIEAMLLERREGHIVKVTVMTLWRSLDDIRAFAGDDIERAVVADEAAALLTDYDRRVTHANVVLADRKK